MASEIRVNQIQNRSGLSTVTFSDTGVVISGITTISDLRTSGNTVVAAGTTAAPSISPTGDSNTGIFFPSADTVAIAEGGVEALRINSSGNIGIGTVPQSWSGFRSLQLGGTTSIWSVEGGQAGSSFYSNNIYYDGSNRRYLTSNAASEYIQDASTGNHVFYGVSSGTAGNTLSGYTEVARFTSSGLKLPSGLGIDFSASSNAAGMTSELLSDYEEGTWTPTMAFATSYGATRSGKYIKVGKTVHVWFEIQVTGWSTGTASTWIQSEPFAIDKVTGCWAAVINGVSTTVDWRIGPWTAAAAGLGVWMAGGQGSVSSTGITMTTSSFDNYSSLTGSLGTSFTMRGGWTYISTT